MSLERQVRLSVVEAALARLATETVGLGARVLLACGRAVDDLSDAFFYFELDAARRYKLLTGEDLGAGAGQPDRHIMQPIPLEEEDED